MIHCIYCLVIVLQVELAHEGNLKTIFQGLFTNENIIIFTLFLVENGSHHHSLEEHQT
jgi:hypothetical protein